jgi:hypothetical protein
VKIFLLLNLAITRCAKLYYLGQLKSLFMDSHMQRKTKKVEQISEHQILQAFVEESNF